MQLHSPLVPERAETGVIMRIFLLIWLVPRVGRQDLIARFGCAHPQNARQGKKPLTGVLIQHVTTVTP